VYVREKSGGGGRHGGGHGELLAWELEIPLGRRMTIELSEFKEAFVEREAEMVIATMDVDSYGDFLVHGP
jgi:hypothetical protein